MKLCEELYHINAEEFQFESFDFCMSQIDNSLESSVTLRIFNRFLYVMHFFCLILSSFKINLSYP